MSTYVISDIHGHYAQFMAMLQAMDFHSQDTLYLLGDVVDRGPDGIKILQYAMMQPNIYPILGNHEYMALSTLSWLVNDEITDEFIAKLDVDRLAGLSEWYAVGGDTTIAEFRRLDAEQRQNLLEYLGEFALYANIMVNGREFVLTHAGLANFAPSRPLADYRLDELIFLSPDYTRQYYPNKYLVTGHTITRRIYAQQLHVAVDALSRDYDRIYREHNHIAIDCACGYDGRLGAICLDTLAEYYV